MIYESFVSSFFRVPVRLWVVLAFSILRLAVPQSSSEQP